MKILLVEDDPSQLKPLKTALTKSGHGVNAVLDDEMAQQLISEREYDVLILDWMLLNVSGVQLCRQHYRK